MSNQEIANQDLGSFDNHPITIVDKYMTNPETCNIEVLERLVKLQDDRDAKVARENFLFEMSQFQRACPVIIKKASGHNIKYAPLSDIITQTKELIAKHGFSYRWEQKQEDSGKIHIKCIISHQSGHCESTTLSAMPDGSGKKNDIQSMGSTVTYLQRYTLIGAFGIACGDEDTDGRSQPTWKSCGVDWVLKLTGCYQAAGMQEGDALKRIGGLFGLELGNLSQLTADQAEQAFEMLQMVIKRIDDKK